MNIRVNPLLLTLLLGSQEAASDFSGRFFGNRPQKDSKERGLTSTLRGKNPVVPRVSSRVLSSSPTFVECHAHTFSYSNETSSVCIEAESHAGASFESKEDGVSSLSFFTGDDWAEYSATFDAGVEYNSLRVQYSKCDNDEASAFTIEVKDGSEWKRLTSVVAAYTGTSWEADFVTTEVPIQDLAAAALLSGTKEIRVIGRGGSGFVLTWFEFFHYETPSEPAVPAIAEQTIEAEFADASENLKLADNEVNWFKTGGWAQYNGVTFDDVNYNECASFKLVAKWAKGNSNYQSISIQAAEPNTNEWKTLGSFWTPGRTVGGWSGYEKYEIPVLPNAAEMMVGTKDIRMKGGYGSSDAEIVAKFECVKKCPLGQLFCEGSCVEGPVASSRVVSRSPGQTEWDTTDPSKRLHITAADGLVGVSTDYTIRISLSVYQTIPNADDRFPLLKFLDPATNSIFADDGLDFYLDGHNCGTSSLSLTAIGDTEFNAKGANGQGFCSCGANATTVDSTHVCSAEYPGETNVVDVLVSREEKIIHGHPVGIMKIWIDGDQMLHDNGASEYHDHQSLFTIQNDELFFFTQNVLHGEYRNEAGNGVYYSYEIYDQAFTPAELDHDATCESLLPSGPSIITTGNQTALNEFCAENDCCQDGDGNPSGCRITSGGVVTMSSDSCVGVDACPELPAGISIGRGSCIGYRACRAIAEDSSYSEVSIGSSSCVGDKACLRVCKGVELGNSFNSSCKIGSNACKGDLEACQDVARDSKYQTVHIDDGSCVGIEACNHVGEQAGSAFDPLAANSSLAIATGACIGPAACEYLSTTWSVSYIQVHANACRGTKACSLLNSHAADGYSFESIIIGENACQSYKTCRKCAVGHQDRFYTLPANARTCADGVIGDPGTLEVHAPTSITTGNQAALNEFCAENGCCQDGAGNPSGCSITGEVTMSIDSCVGVDACPSLPPGISIGQGSCTGELACRSLPAGTSIGQGSCTGEKACNEFGKGSGYSEVTIGDSSCTGDFACDRVCQLFDDPAGSSCVIDSVACKGDYACYEFAQYSGYSKVSVGSLSCIGNNACYSMCESDYRYLDNPSNSTCIVGSDACKGGSNACYSVARGSRHHTVSVDDGSCVGMEACESIGFDSKVAAADSSLAIATGACNGLHACKGLTSRWSVSYVQVDANACRGRLSCSFLNSEANGHSFTSISIGENACQQDGACQECTVGDEGYNYSLPANANNCSAEVITAPMSITTGNQTALNEFCAENGCCQDGAGNPSGCSITGEVTMSIDSCVGVNACPSLPAGISIGQGSCTGELACPSLRAGISIGHGSCKGYRACSDFGYGSGYSEVSIGDSSCTGAQVCDRVCQLYDDPVGSSCVIDSVACKGDYACFLFAQHSGYSKVSIGSLSCLGNNACNRMCVSSDMDNPSNSTCIVGSDACKGGSNACCHVARGSNHHTISVDDGACVGMEACESIGDGSDVATADSSLAIATGACNGLHACKGLTSRWSVSYVQVDANACRGRLSCSFLNSEANGYSFTSISIGENACQQDGACQECTVGDEGYNYSLPANANDCSAEAITAPPDLYHCHGAQSFVEGTGVQMDARGLHDTYTIRFKVRFDEADYGKAYLRLIKFGVDDDEGFYLHRDDRVTNTKVLYWYDIWESNSTLPSGAFRSTTDEVIVTRDGSTKEIKTYLNGLLHTFADTNSTVDEEELFVFPLGLTTFDMFKDDDAGEGEDGGGWVEYIEVWNAVKSLPLPAPGCI